MPQDTLLVFLDDAGEAWGNFEEIHNCWGKSVLLRKVNEEEVLLVGRLLVGTLAAPSANSE